VSLFLIPFSIFFQGSIKPRSTREKDYYTSLNPAKRYHCSKSYKKSYVCKEGVGDAEDSMEAKGKLDSSNTTRREMMTGGAIKASIAMMLGWIPEEHTAHRA
jgi:hypothetical protein